MPYWDGTCDDCGSREEVTATAMVTMCRKCLDGEVEYFDDQLEYFAEKTTKEEQPDD